MKYNLLFWSSKYIWKKHKTLIISTLIFSILIGITPYFSLRITKELLNEISDLITNKSIDYLTVVLLLCSQLLIQFLASMLQFFQQHIEKKQLVFLEHNLKLDIFEKSKSIPLLVYDDPTYHDQFSRINTNIAIKFWLPLKSISELIKTIINLLSYSLILLSIHWIVLIVCMFATVPLFIIYSRLEKKRYNFSVDNTLINREIGFLSHILTDRQYVKELRVFSLNNYFIDLWSRKYKEYSTKAVNMEMRQYFTRLMFEGINSIFYIINSLFILFMILKSKSILIGDFVVINQALTSTQNSLNQFSMIFAEIKNSTLYLDEYYNFLHKNYETTKTIDKNTKYRVNPTNEYITIKSLSFKYPNQTINALNDINISIKQGEKVAILGDNGSGKSTLIKCLLGLYSEYSGKIEIQGVEIKGLEEEFRKKFSIAFQDFIKYPYSIKENIIFGDINKNDVEEEFVNAGKKTGIHETITGLSDGYNTHLGNYLKQGIEFSGGQWQKLAISRALFKDTEIMIFDEPTASLDPKSEFELYNELFRHTHGRTLIFVSHRIAAARYADKIIMMRNGEVVEQGTHEELIKYQGDYHNLFSAQSNWLLNDDSFSKVGV